MWICVRAVTAGKFRNSIRASALAPAAWRYWPRGHNDPTNRDFPALPYPSQPPPSSAHDKAFIPQQSKVGETGILAQRLCFMQIVHYATIGFLIACMIWAAVMVLYKAR
jgi:hypothetical protein